MTPRQPGARPAEATTPDGTNGAPKDVSPGSAGARRPFAVRFVEVHYQDPVVLPAELIAQLPPRIILFTTIQYLPQLSSWRAALAAAGKETFLFRPKHSAHEGQLLGCGIERWSAAVRADAFLFVGDGLFHPRALLIHNELPVYCYDPKREQWHLLTDEELEQVKKRHRAALSRFFMARKVGVLVTTKSGQQRLVLARKLKERYPEKEFTFVLVETLDYQALEDFSFVEVWVNTMCPRIGFDDTNKTARPVVNIGELGFAW